MSSRTDYGIFFRRDDLVIRLPINPEILPEARTTENGDYNVLGIGQITVPRTPNLRTVTISSFFPARPFSGVLTVGEFREPEFYINFFSAAMTDKARLLYTPVRYYEDGAPFLTSDTGFEVIVSAFRTEERGGETGDFYYELELTEYRDYSPLMLQIQQTASTAGDTVVSTVNTARSIPDNQLTVGAECTLNGNFYYTSYGAEPHGSGSGRTVIISRIVDTSRAKPIHITDTQGNPLGWVSAAELNGTVAPVSSGGSSNRSTTQSRTGTAAGGSNAGSSGTASNAGTFYAGELAQSTPKLQNAPQKAHTRQKTVAVGTTTVGALPPKQNKKSSIYGGYDLNDPSLYLGN